MNINGDIVHNGKLVDHTRGPSGDDAPAGSAWLPIETAPKDGFHMLLYRPKIVFVGYYGGANSGWRHNAPGLDAIWPLPTHWMPIPSLPNTKVEHASRPNQQNTCG